MRKKKLFLASSEELKSDREQFEIFLSRKNQDWVNKDVFIDLSHWEDFLDKMADTSLQNEYNKVIQECDIFVMLFFTKVGPYTLEEFETAFGKFRSTGKPFIFTYFKDAQISTGSANQKDLMSLWAFQAKLKSLGHFQSIYTNIDDLKHKFSQQLDKLANSGFIELNFRNEPLPTAHENTQSYLSKKIVIVLAICGVLLLWFFIYKIYTPNERITDVVNGEWSLVRTDSKANNGSGEQKRVQTIWKGKYSSDKGIIKGDLTEQTEFGVTNSKKIDGIVSGVLRAELLSLSYGSRDMEGPGSGAWILKRVHDGHKTFIGQAFGYDCTQGKVTRCPALLTQEVEFAVKTYSDDLAQPCVEIPLTKQQTSSGTKEDSTCSK